MAGSKLQRRAGPLARVRLNDLFRLQRIRAVIGCRHASAVSCARRDLARLPDGSDGGVGERRLSVARRREVGKRERAEVRERARKPKVEEGTEGDEMERKRRKRGWDGGERREGRGEGERKRRKKK